MTVQLLINWALRLIGVLASGETPATEESDDAFLALNRIVGSWNEVMERVLKGSFASIFYTFTPLAAFTSLSQNIDSLPLGVHRALAHALAIELATEYGRPIDEKVIAAAQQARAAIMTLPQPPTA